MPSYNLPNLSMWKWTIFHKGKWIHCFLCNDGRNSRTSLAHISYDYLRFKLRKFSELWKRRLALKIWERSLMNILWLLPNFCSSYDIRFKYFQWFTYHKVQILIWTSSLILNKQAKKKQTKKQNLNDKEDCK